mmetsp:Transcript_4001/g.13367  ORF Transcript_4001/g.13367 Transcript_4001/m.13367 type:complete len:381 (-) Transcript_4001:688-1830(-)
MTRWTTAPPQQRSAVASCQRNRRTRIPFSPPRKRFRRGTELCTFLRQAPPAPSSVRRGLPTRNCRPPFLNATEAASRTRRARESLCTARTRFARACTWDTQRLEEDLSSFGILSCVRFLSISFVLSVSEYPRASPPTSSPQASRFLAPRFRGRARTRVERASQVRAPVRLLLLRRKLRRRFRRRRRPSAAAPPRRNRRRPTSHPSPVPPACRPRTTALRLRRFRRFRASRCRRPHPRHRRFRRSSYQAHPAQHLASPSPPATATGIGYRRKTFEASFAAEPFAWLTASYPFLASLWLPLIPGHSRRPRPPRRSPHLPLAHPSPLVTATGTGCPRKTFEEPGRGPNDAPGNPPRRALPSRPTNAACSPAPRWTSSCAWADR